MRQVEQMGQVFDPHAYQRAAIEAILDRPALALWMEMGLGKTVVTLTAIEALLHDACTVGRVLVIAPKKVAEATWQDEAAKWAHLRGLRIATVLGKENQRIAALQSEAEIYITGRDLVSWLVGYCLQGGVRGGRGPKGMARWPFDMVVLDEASSFKNPRAERFLALKRVRPQIQRLVELTGTPAPNDLLDLWAQVYLLDGGARLGRCITHYRQRWFEPDKASYQRVYSWRPKPGAEQAIRTAVADVVLAFGAQDQLQLPPLTVEDIPVKLHPAARDAYRRMERHCLLQLDGQDITAQQAATLVGKLLQLCSGSVYDDAHTAHLLHRCKLQAFGELVEALGGQHVLVFYGFRFEEEQLLALGAAHKDKVFRVLRTQQDAADWNAGKVDVLLAHPASCAYGLNLQAGGRHLVWYTLPWSLELYEQGTARLYRQGQTQPVMVHRLLVKDSADELVAHALAQKGCCQQALIQGLKTRLESAREETKNDRGT